MAYTTPQGLTSDSYQNMISGAGAAYLDLDIPETGATAEEVSDILYAATAAGKCLGATTGAFSIDTTYDTTEIESDGKVFNFIGSTKLNVMNAEVSTTLQEFTPDSLMAVFGNGEYDGSANRLRFKMQFSNESYIPTVWLVMARIGGGYVVIKMKNALNVAGTTITTNNDNVAELPITLRAHQSGLADDQYSPLEIYLCLPETATPGGAPVTPQSASVSATKATANKTSK